MLICHEGLPGSGKSYEACAYQMLPALKAGRRVVTNIEGISHEKFAELTGLPLAQLQSQLTPIYDPDIDKQRELILQHSGKDALVVIDEVQNLFPSNREKLTPEWNRYISEHRHDGLDVILMTQDRRDMHAMWRRRIQRVFVFQKLSAVGMDGSYRWECFEATRPEKYQKISSGVRKYDSQFFGLYKSHTDGTSNTSNMGDSRANLWNNKALKWGAVALCVGLYLAVSYLSDFFQPEPKEEAPKVAQVAKPTPSAASRPAPRQAPPEEPKEEPPLDLFDEFARKNRVRLSALVQSPDGERTLAYIDVMDSQYRVKDRYTMAGLTELGWTVTVHAYGVRLKKGDREYIATAWPLEEPGRASDHTIERTRGQPVAAADSSMVTAQQRPLPVLIPDSTPYPARTL